MWNCAGKICGCTHMHCSDSPVPFSPFLPVPWLQINFLLQDMAITLFFWPQRIPDLESLLKRKYSYNRLKLETIRNYMSLFLRTVGCISKEEWVRSWAAVTCCHPVGFKESTAVAGLPLLFNLGRAARLILAERPGPHLLHVKSE